MKKTLLAVGAFVVLLGLVLLTREEQVNEGVPRLELPALGEVTAFELTGPQPASLKLEHGAWTVAGHAADDAHVNALLDALKDLRGQDFVTAKPQRHAELEVDDAKGVKLLLSTTAGASWRLVFGKAAKSGGTYLREAGSSAVFTTNSPVGYQVKKGVSGWRKKAIATASAAELMRVTVAQAESTFTLLGADGTWRLEPAPAAGFRFDAGAAQRLVQQLSSLQAQDFAESDVEPMATIELGLKGGQKLALRLGAKRADGTAPLRVGDDPQTYLISQWTADQLLKKVDDLRDTTLLAFEAEDVKRLALSAGGKSTVLERDGAGWKVLEPRAPPAGFELDPQAVASQLARLKGLRAARVVSNVADAAAGLTSPSAMVELSTQQGKQTLRLGRETPTGELYAKGSTDALTYAIGAQEKTTLEQGLELFKKRPPPDLSQMRGLEQLPPEVRRQLEAQLRQQPQ